MGAWLGFCGGSGLVAWLKMVASLLIASICLSPMLEKGALGVGFCSACVSSAAAVVAFSVEEGNGIVQLWGKIRPCLLFYRVLCCLCTLGGVVFFVCVCILFCLGKLDPT